MSTHVLYELSKGLFNHFSARLSRHHFKHLSKSSSRNLSRCHPAGKGSRLNNPHIIICLSDNNLSMLVLLVLFRDEENGFNAISQKTAAYLTAVYSSSQLVKAWDDVSSKFS